MVNLNFASGPIPFAGPLVCSFYGRPCARYYEAKESALIHALIHLNDTLRYKIGDIRYMDYAIACCEY